MPPISVNFDERFPTLRTSPSIEAAVYWVVHAGKALEPEALKAELTQRLPNYPTLQNQQGIEFGASVFPDGSSKVGHRTQWNGFRLQDETTQHVVQFRPEGVVFSRLKPYENWKSFIAEALRLWEIFVDLAQPTVIQRLGVRHINQIPLKEGEQPSTYLKMEPYSLPALDINPDNFFYKDTYKVPDYPYEMQWIRTTQPESLPESQKALIVDIDVCTNTLLQLDQENMIKRLQEMRWLKNKLFFESITETALSRFGA